MQFLPCCAVSSLPGVLLIRILGRYFLNFWQLDIFSLPYSLFVPINMCTFVAQ